VRLPYPLGVLAKVKENPPIVLNLRKTRNQMEEMVHDLIKRINDTT